jgi:hypothetical protein
MKHYLLIGAGFSRNWGGWLASEVFEYLLGDPDVTRDAQLRALLWKNQPRGGFEVALAELRQTVQRDPSQRQTLIAFETAIVKMFEAMNQGYGLQPFEFRTSLVDRRPVQAFLGRFAAIFSLNQDLLLERHYLANKDNGYDFESWKEWQLPGMQRASRERGTITSSATELWEPSGNHVLGPEQPIFKLHGSSNWRTADAKDLLILGGGKNEAIASYPVLKWYFEELSERLHAPDVRLMVTGYGFGDDHVNQVLSSAIKKGLRIFVVDPSGSDVAKVRNSTAQPGAIYAKSPLEEDLEAALIGASRRSLREIFGSDEIERAKVMRFFGP